MRFKFLYVLGFLFLVAGIVVVATNLDDAPQGGHWVHRPSGGMVYRSRGGGMLIMGGAWIFVGVVLSVVGFLVGRSAAATAKLLATGLAGKATITGLTQTGMYVNRNPQIAMDLMVDVPGRAPYPVNHREIVPMMFLGRLTTGVPLSVKVDPADPQRLAVDWSSTVFAASPTG